MFRVHGLSLRRVDLLDIVHYIELSCERSCCIHERLETHMSFDELRTDLHDAIFLHEEIATCWCAILDDFWSKIFDRDDFVSHLDHATWLEGLDFLFGFFSFCDDLLDLDGISFLHEDIHLDFSDIVFTGLLPESFESDLHLTSFLLDMRDTSIEWGDLSEVLRIASFEELLDTRETCRDITSFLRDSSRVECTHRELCPWLTDRLSGDDAYWGTDLHDISGREIETITLLTYSLFCLTCEYRSDCDFHRR
jgi:uncharacterized protein Smg (DUF494 family)